MNVIEELQDMQRNNDPDHRRRMLSRFADMFFDNAEHYSDRLLVQFSDVLADLLQRVDPETRAEIAERIADAPHASQALHLFLAQAELDVAAPVLRRSKVLDDHSLVEIASSKSEGHRLAIAMREHLSETVTDVLVDLGEPTVLQAVTMNLGAEISATSFGKLAAHAESDDVLLEAMSYRPDLTREAADKVLRLLPNEARSRLAALLAADRDSVRPLLTQAAWEAKQQRLDRALDRLETKGLVRQVLEGELTRDVVVKWLAGKDRVLDLALVFSELADFREPVMASCLLKADNGPLVVLARSLDLSEDAVRSVAVLRCRRLGLPLSARDMMMERWRAIGPDTAKRAMRFTRLRSAHAAAA